MGSMSRYERSSQFIGAFNKRYVERAPIKAGDVLTVTSVGLGLDEVAAAVRMYVSVKRGVDDLQLCFEEIDFDPEANTGNVLIGLVMQATGLTVDDVTARLKAADLL